MTTGIYALYWEEQDLTYIGQSQDIESRYKEHLYKMKNNKHTNYKVQNAFNLYGGPKLQILEECSIDRCNELEIYYTKDFDSINNGLNIVEAGSVGWGVNSNASKYTKWQILKVFSLLYRTNLPLRHIAKKCSVPLHLPADIVKGCVHTWLQVKYPDKFSLIRQKVLNRARQKESSDRAYTLNNLVQVKDPLGRVYAISTSVKEFCRLHGLNSGPVSEVINGKRKHNKGWTLASIMPAPNF